MGRLKKGQEEIVGFVVIVVLIAVIALVFLAISLRKAPVELNSREVSSFLQSASRYTTDCYISQERRYDVKDLVISCQQGERCLSGSLACDVLNATLTEMFNTALNPGEENKIKAYKSSIRDEVNRTILELRKGKCTGKITGAFVSIPSYSGVTRLELEICS